MSEKKIRGGFYLKARCVQESDIATAPPHVREIWDWLLLKAFFKDGKDIKKGQVLASYDDIREGLKWYVGWRKMMYTKHNCEIAMKWLKKATMITTEKTTRGMIITILNYEKYQDPENYESHNETYRKATRKPQTADTIEKKKEEKKEYNNKPPLPPLNSHQALTEDGYPWLDPIWDEWLAYRTEIKKPYKTKSAITKTLNFLSKHKANQRQIIEQSIQNEWQGLFEPKGNGGRKGSGPMTRGERNFKAAQEVINELRREGESDGGPAVGGESFETRPGQDANPRVVALPRRVSGGQGA